MRNWCFVGAAITLVGAILLWSETLVTTGTVWLCTAFILDAIEKAK